MDKTDQKIIRELQRDGRLTNQELAERVNLSPSPCLRRLRNLEQQGIIRGYSAIVDQKRYGLPVTVFVRIKLQHHTEQAVGEFETAIKYIDEILEAHLMTGDWDYLLRVIVASLEDYERFTRQSIHRIPGVAGIETSFAYGEVKRTNLFPAI
ncbi:HTH-type transcriptional regulator LrpA [Maritalea myrionectae]|uniref:HTH-type transcriptional regulator LrpA n=1 Tax=Maritalea myrionectae TaxID=454601 RepID=A0A2R4MD63_9HYPH|nr:Lrp/AsnC family transcriptional regulator [Maritalea myrionectae]AVX03913.1 HTH-type transcriptional regulator LrpA [Maritalea myrionectae]